LVFCLPSFFYVFRVDGGSLFPSFLASLGDALVFPGFIAFFFGG